MLYFSLAFVGSFLLLNCSILECYSPRPLALGLYVYTPRGRHKTLSEIICILLPCLLVYHLSTPVHKHHESQRKYLISVFWIDGQVDERMRGGQGGKQEGRECSSDINF